MIEAVEKLLARMSDLGAERFYLKKLAPNDNSKNQLYLGSPTAHREAETAKAHRG